MQFPCAIIGADGGHSTLRQLLGTPLIGRDYPEHWQVAEIATDQWDSTMQAQLYLQKNGTGLFLSQPVPGIVQGILNAPVLMDSLLAKFPNATIRYVRDFRVSLKQVEKNRIGRFWLIGDAAHTQSPVGGQGLNLAIYDGVTLGVNLGARAEAEIENRLHHQARKTLRFTDFDYRMLSSRSSTIRHARNGYWRFAARHPAIAKWFFRIISGL